MTGTVLKQIDLAAKIGQDGSAMQAMHALGVIRDLIAGYTAKLTTAEDERAAFEAWATHLPMDRQPLQPDLYMPPVQWAWEAWQFRATLVQPSQDAPYADGIAADLERSDWTPEDALRWYAAGKHFDTTNGRTRIIDTGAIASNALEHLSLPSPAQAEAEQLREAYEWGYGDGQSNPNGYSDKKERDACVNKLLKQPSPAQAEQAEAERPPQPERYTADVFHPERPYYMAQTSVVRASDFDEFATQYERIVGALRAVIAQLRQHKNDYMDSGQETYRALQNEIREREAEIARLDGLVSSRTAERDAAQAEVERLRQGMKGDYDIDAWLEWTKERDTALARVAELESKLADTQPYKQHPQIVGYARKKELAPLLDPTQPDGSHIYIGLDHPACWAEEPPYEFLTPLYTGPVTQNSVPDGYVLVPVEPLLNMMSDKDHDTRITAERRLLSILAAAPVNSAQHSVPEEFSFEYRHPNGESHTVTVSRDQVISEMSDFLFEALCSKFCNCEPVGETNVVECSCDEYAEEFKLLAAAPGTEVPQAWLDVQAERRRQVGVEGWTPEHDDAHACDEIAAFACFYAMPPAARDWDASSTGYGDTLGKAVLPEGWEPKTGDRRRELVKACALALAEIERLDRAAEKEQE